MLSIEHLQDKTERWLSDLHFTINLRKGSRTKPATVIVQGFIEVEVGENIYTFIQEAQCDSRDTFNAKVAQLIVAVRMQHSIALWRQAKFRPLQTVSLARKTIIVTPKASHPFHETERHAFVINNVQQFLTRKCQYSFSPYPHNSIPHTFNNVVANVEALAAISYKSSQHTNNWHLLTSEFIDTILPTSQFDIYEALESVGAQAVAAGFDPTFLEDAQCEALLNKVYAVNELLTITGNLGVPEHVTPAQLDSLDAEIAKRRPSSEQYQDHKYLEIDQPMEKFNAPELAKLVINEVFEMPDTRRLALRRQGENDLEIELYRNNAWIPSYMSDLRKGEFFLIAQQSPYGELPSNRCFHARDGVRIIPTSNPANPTFMVQGLEIVTAPATPMNERALRPSRNSVTGIGYYDDETSSTAIRNNAPAALLFQTKPTTPSN